MKIAKINLYSFDELSEFAKEKAVHQHSIYLNEHDARGREFSVTETIGSIEDNKYLFLPDGTRWVYGYSIA